MLDVVTHPPFLVFNNSITIHVIFPPYTDEGNQALQEFLLARNPKQQHSSTLESYLIKPIQRILKYPLLLQQLRNLTDPHCEEHLHLVGEWDRERTHVRIMRFYLCVCVVSPFKFLCVRIMKLEQKSCLSFKQRHSRAWKRWRNT